MTKKVMLTILSVFVLLSISLGLVACGTDKEPQQPIHEHTFDIAWEKNEITHWHKATCEHTDLVSSFGNHTFDENNKCSVCGYEKEELSDKRYIVNFVTNSKDSIDPYILKEGDIIEKPLNPTKTDYTFLNWYDNSELSGTPYAFGGRINKNITLYASWGVKVTFISRDGKVYREEVMDINEKTYSPQVPLVINMQFIGWFDDPYYEEPRFDFNTPISKNISLYAGYGYQITYLSYDKSIISKEVILENKIPVKPSDPERDYYDFDNWYLEESFATPYQFNEILTCDITLYSKFNPKIYQINYHNVDGLVHSNPSTYTYGEGIESINDITQNDIPNDKFYGWYFDEDYKVLASSISTSTHGTIDIYAKRATLYSITYQNWPSNLALNNNPTTYTKYDEIVFDKSNIESITGFSDVRLKINGIAVPGIPLNTAGDIVVDVTYTKKITKVTIDPNGGKVMPIKPFIYVDFLIDGMDPVKVYLSKDENNLTNIYDPKVLKLPNSSKTFFGYFFDKELMKMLTSDNVNEIESGSTVYAKWVDFQNVPIAPLHKLNETSSLSENIFIPVNVDKVLLSFSSGAIQSGSLVVSDVLGDTKYVEIGPSSSISITDREIEVNGGSFLHLYFSGESPFPITPSYSIDIAGYGDCFVKPLPSANVFEEEFLFNEIYELADPTKDLHEFIGWIDSNDQILSLDNPWGISEDTFSLTAKYKSTKIATLIVQLSDHYRYLKSELDDVVGLNSADEELIIERINSIMAETRSTLEDLFEYDEAREAYLQGIDAMTEEALSSVREHYANEMKVLCEAYKSLLMIEGDDSPFDNYISSKIDEFKSDKTLEDLKMHYNEGKQDLRTIFENMT